MKLQLYKLRWTDEGIGYRRSGYFILKPDEHTFSWRLRKVKGVKGKQQIEYENDFPTEKEAFKAGNIAVRSSSKIRGRVRL